MNILVVVGHPKYETSSSQQFFIESLKQFKTVDCLYLSQEQVDLSYLKKYDRIILQFPIFWYQAPAIVKVWIESILVGNLNVLANKELGIVVTIDEAERQFKAGGKEKFTVDEMLRPFEMLANTLKMTYLPVKAIHQFDYLSDDDKQRLLVAYQYYVTRTVEDTFENYGQWLITQLEAIDNTAIFTNLIRENMEEIQSLSLFGEMYDV